MSTIVSTEQIKPKKTISSEKQRQYQLTYREKHRDKYLATKITANQKYRNKDVDKVKRLNAKYQAKYIAYKNEVLRLRNIDLF
jgi:hypothetical protein